MGWREREGWTRDLEIPADCKEGELSAVEEDIK